MKEHPRWEVKSRLTDFASRVFSKSTRWDVESRRGLGGTTSTKPDTHWVLIEQNRGCAAASACSRLRPARYMPTSSPPSLAKPPPRGNDVWADPPRHRRRPGPRLENGISELTLRHLPRGAGLRQGQGIRELVAVVSLPVERIFRRLGLPIERLSHRQAVDLGAVRGSVSASTWTSVSTAPSIALPGPLPAGGDALLAVI